VRDLKRGVGGAGSLLPSPLPLATSEHWRSKFCPLTRGCVMNTDLLPCLFSSSARPTSDPSAVQQGSGCWLP
jgi:hypothetical protein